MKMIAPVFMALYFGIEVVFRQSMLYVPHGERDYGKFRVFHIVRIATCCLLCEVTYYQCQNLTSLQHSV